MGYSIPIFLYPSPMKGLFYNGTAGDSNDRQINNYFCKRRNMKPPVPDDCIFKTSPGYEIFKEINLIKSLLQDGFNLAGILTNPNTPQ